MRLTGLLLTVIGGWLLVACELGEGKEPIDASTPDAAVTADGRTGGPEVGGEEDVGEEPEAICGNGSCEEGEDPCTCQSDCKGFDKCCADLDCPQPNCGPCCTAVCIDFECQPLWLEPCCWNNQCEEGETPESCPQDCPGVPGCGDGICQEDEDSLTCPLDCPDQQECAADSDCPQPLCGPCCHAFCVAGKCEDQWAENCCWNGQCEEGETPENCPEDCTNHPACGDGLCQGDEDNCSCPADCKEKVECCADLDCPQPKCGPCCKGICNAEHQCEELWLEPCCWNGKCEEGENEKTCPEDCSGPGKCVNFFACESDLDCVKADLGCCPCSMGGKSFALNADCVDDWKESLNCPPGLMCPAVYMCDDSVAVCLNGQCALAGETK